MRNAEPAPWKVPCENCPLRGKAVFRQFSETELEFVILCAPIVVGPLFKPESISLTDYRIAAAS